MAALTSESDYTSGMVKTLGKRRNLIVDLLNEIEGIRCLKPGGAFYVFPNTAELGKSAELAMSILKNTGVIVTPGTAFGKGGEGFIRLSYATSEENIIEGLKRISEYLNIYMEQKIRGKGGYLK